METRYEEERERLQQQLQAEQNDLLAKYKNREVTDLARSKSHFLNPLPPRSPANLAPFVPKWSPKGPERAIQRVRGPLATILGQKAPQHRGNLVKRLLKNWVLEGVFGLLRSKGLTNAKNISLTFFSSFSYIR